MPVYWINDAAPITFIKEEQNFNPDMPILLNTHSKQDQPKLKRNLEYGTINKIFNENIMQKPIIIYSRSKRHNYKENKINNADSNLSPDADLEIDIIKTEDIKNETDHLDDARIIEVRVTSSVAISRGSDREVDPIALAGSERRSIATYPVNSSDLANKQSFRTGRKNRPRSFSYTSIYNDYRQKDPVDVIWTERKIDDAAANSFSTFVNHNDDEVTIEPRREDAKLPIVYSEPAKVYSEPAKVYSEPAKVYGEAELVYSEPAKIYSEPAKIYSEPAKIYSEPAKVYGEPAKFYSEPASLHIHQNCEDETRRTWKPRVRTDPPTTETQIKMKEHSSEQNYEVDESTSVESNGRVHGVQEIDVPNNGKKVGYVVEGKNYRKYRVEERTSDGFIVGEYGVFSHDDGSLRGVRYTADGQTHPRLIYDALLKFLSL